MDPVIKDEIGIFIIQFPYISLTKGFEDAPVSSTISISINELYSSLPMLWVFFFPTPVLPEKLTLISTGEELRKSWLHTLALKFQGHSFEGTRLFFASDV